MRAADARAATALDPAAASRGQANTRPFADCDELDRLRRSAGLAEVTTGELHAGASYVDSDDLWLPLIAPDGSPDVYFAELEERDALRQEVRRRLDSPAGSFRLMARAQYVRGHA